MRAVTVIWLIACGGPAKPTSPPKPTDPWNPPVATPDPNKRAWTLELESHYGPCPPDDERSCHMTWTATPDGTITYVESPNKPGPDKVVRHMMTVEDRDLMTKLVDGDEFQRGIENGFDCEGPAPEYDATLRLIFTTGGKTYRQFGASRSEPRRPGCSSICYAASHSTLFW